jgi:glycosyltransferase involved in cell wall biosynthesis
LRILIADQYSEPGGAQKCLIDLLPAFVDRGWRPVMIAPGEGRLKCWCIENNIPMQPLPLSDYRPGRKTVADVARFARDRLRMSRAIARTANEFGCDLIYVNGPRVMPSMVGLGLRTVFHAHSTINGVFARGLVVRALRREQARIIAISRFVGRQFDGLDAEVLHNGVADYSSERPPYSGGIRVGLLGRIAPEKGQTDFVEAARLILRQIPDAQFHIFGQSMFADTSYEQKVRAMAAGLPVTFQGWQEPAVALASTDILSVPSGPTEGMGRVIAEGFSARVPVVAYASGGIPEFIEHGRTGFLTEDRTAESLARTVMMLARDPELRHRIAEAAREEWRLRFTRESYQQRVCAFLEAVC